MYTNIQPRQAGTCVQRWAQAQVVQRMAQMLGHRQAERERGTETGQRRVQKMDRDVGTGGRHEDSGRHGNTYKNRTYTETGTEETGREA